MTGHQESTTENLSDISVRQQAEQPPMSSLGTRECFSHSENPDGNLEDTVANHGSSDLVCVPEQAESSTSVAAVKRFRPLQFAIGLALTSMAVTSILWIAIRVLDIHHFGGRFALALVAFVILSSVMMLGAGFALMATAAAGFDDSEFDRLLHSGNISSAVETSQTVERRGSPRPRKAA